MAGQVRTLSHPAVYRSIVEHLLTERSARDGSLHRHALFAVLGTGESGGRLEPPTSLATALRALAPRRVRLVNAKTPEPPCGGNVHTLQWPKWADCADLVRAEEGATGERFEFLLKTRPDVVWRAPIELSVLASRVPSDDVVVLANDWHVLWHRSQWGVLDLMRNVTCDRRVCGSGKHEEVTVESFAFGDANEYCLLQTHLARHGARAIECSHPQEKWILTYVTDMGRRDNWLRQLSWTASNGPTGTSPTLARWRSEGSGAAYVPPEQPFHLGVTCVSNMSKHYAKRMDEVREVSVQCEHCTRRELDAEELEAVPKDAWPLPPLCPSDDDDSKAVVVLDRTFEKISREAEVMRSGEVVAERAEGSSSVSAASTRATIETLDNAIFRDWESVRALTRGHSHEQGVSLLQVAEHERQQEEDERSVTP